MPEISVLMPVYNAEKYLKEAMDSILGQTFRDFEFLVIDDGSTDRSSDIIASYQDSRIKYYRNQENTGIRYTLNKGIELAGSALIARMDADDISYPDRLQKQYAYLQEHPDCAMVSSQASVMSEDGSFLWLDKLKSEHYYYNLTFICWIYHPTVMYRKEAVKDVDMYTADYSEDFELFWQISRKYKFYNLPEVLLDYRLSNQSLHQVLKKKEYELAQQEQLLRNLRYYVGNDYTLPDSFLQCFRHNFDPLLAEQKTQTIIACVKELDAINQCILGKDNINHDVQAIKKAAAYKRAYILSHYRKRLPLHKGMYLWLWSISLASLMKKVKSYLKLIFK